jgi:broad specificity phosphatase PhoE
MKNTTNTLLIRHGVTEANLKDIYQGSSTEDLSSQGVLQVGKLCQRLSSSNIQAVYSSPLKRTKTTASRIAQDKKIPLHLREELKEIGFGLWEGLTREETRRRWPEIWKELLIDPGSISIPGGESFRETMERAVGVFEELNQKHANQTIAIVTHEIIIKMIVIHVLQASTSIYNRFQVDCASITTVTKPNGKLIHLNDTSHF